MLTTGWRCAEDAEQFYMHFTDEETEAESLKSLAQGSKVLSREAGTSTYRGLWFEPLCHLLAV